MMSPEELRLCEGLRRVADRARAWASYGTPAEMLAVYVEIQCMHEIGGHPGEAMDCTSCHDALRAVAR